METASTITRNAPSALPCGITPAHSPTPTLRDDPQQRHAETGDVPGEIVPGTYTNHPVGVLAWRRCPPDVRETGPTHGRYRMDWLTDVIEFIRQRPERFLDLVSAHLRLSFTSLA